MMPDNEKHALMEFMGAASVFFISFWPLDLPGYLAFWLKWSDLFDHPWSLVMLLVCLRPICAGLTSMLYFPLNLELYPDDEDDDDDDEGGGGLRERHGH